jgi:hypothetical protein
VLRGTDIAASTDTRLLPSPYPSAATNDPSFTPGLSR